MANNNQNKTVKIVTLFASLFFCLNLSSNTVAKTWIPDAPDTIIATFKTFKKLPEELENLRLKVQQQPESLTASLNLVEAYFNYAKLPGNSRYYDYAQATLEKISDNKNSNNLTQNQAIIERILISKANLLQQRHEFSNAIEQLKKIPQSSAYSTQSLLIQSRIFLITKEISQAQQACQKLLGKSQLTLAQLCLIEIQIATDKSKQALTMLQPHLKNKDLYSQEIQQWLYQLSGNASQQVNDYQNAEKWFSKNLSRAPVSQWLAWSEAAIKNKQATKVYQKITELTEINAALEDSLLLRLAHAEKILFKEQKNQWRSVVQQRIHLRQLRQDEQHASDLAYYYVYIQNDAEKALYWAELNWQSAKEPNDEKLLRLAQQLASSNEVVNSEK